MRTHENAVQLLRTKMSRSIQKSSVYNYLSLRTYGSISGKNWLIGNLLMNSINLRFNLQLKSTFFVMTLPIQQQFKLKTNKLDTLSDVTFSRSRRRLIIHLPVNMFLSIHVNTDFVSSIWFYYSTLPAYWCVKFVLSVFVDELCRVRCRTATINRAKCSIWKLR